MTAGLLDRGYQAPIFLGESGDDWTRGAARRRGFERAMKAAGLSPERTVQVGKPPLSIDDGAAALPALMDRFPDADCVVCVSDLAAFGLLSALNAKGLKVPEDMGIAGFGNFEVSRFSTPTISTVIVDPRRIGVAAGQLIGRLLKDPGTAQDRVQISVKAEVQYRESTRTKAD